MKIREFKKRTTNIRSWTAPTPERHNHNGGVISEAIAWDRYGEPMLKRYRAVWECPLDIYKSLNFISKAEHAAGIRFRRTYYHAILCRGTGYGHGNTHAELTKPTPSERLLSEAYEAIPAQARETVIGICGHNRLAYDQRSIGLLRDGLGHLALRWQSAAFEVTGQIKRQF